MNRNIKQVVYKILKEDSYARKDDWYLIQEASIRMTGCNPGTAFGQVLQAMKNKKISLESITRVRRKFFEEYPELKNAKVEQARRHKEEEYYLEYMRRT